MARFFFHSRDGQLCIDGEGSELPSLEEAKVEAAQMLSEALNKRPELIWATGHFTICVTDEAGNMLFTLTLAAVMSPGVVVRPPWTVAPPKP